MTAAVHSCRAVSIAGDLAGLPPSGAVHSVFAAAVNLIFDRQGLAVLLPRERGNGPGFILLEDAPADFRSWNLAPGSRVFFEGNRLRLPGVDVLLAKATVWEPPRPGQGDFRDLEALLSPLLPPPAELTERAVAARAKLLERKLDAPGEVLPLLLGAGPGLTPAGDDFVVGLLAGLAAGGRQAESERLGAALRLALEVRPRITTEVSRHFLEAAARGIFCEFFLLFIKAAGERVPKAIIRQAGTVLGFGSSSGAWLLRGFLAGASLRQEKH